MKTTTWILPWKAKAELARLTQLLGQRDAVVDGMKQQLHTASTHLIEARKSELEWKSAAEDHEKALQEAVTRLNSVKGRQSTDSDIMATLRGELASAKSQLLAVRKDLVDRNAELVAAKELTEAMRKTVSEAQNATVNKDALSLKLAAVELELADTKRRLAEAAEGNRKVKEWIVATHRLEKPAAESTIKALLQRAHSPTQFRFRKMT